MTFFCGLVNFSNICEAKKDYYKVLGVEKSASDKEIKKAFRNLALQYHPDKNPDKDTSKKFREIAEAYEVLRDEDKRRQYDQNGHNAWGGSNSGGFKPGNFNFADVNFEEFFNSPFGHHDDSDMFGRDMDMFGSSQKIRTETRNGQKCKTVTQKVGNMVTT